LTCIWKKGRVIRDAAIEEIELVQLASWIDTIHDISIEWMEEVQYTTKEWVANWINLLVHVTRIVLDYNTTINQKRTAKTK
jgi:hypothetical protein